MKKTKETKVYILIPATYYADTADPLYSLYEPMEAEFLANSMNGTSNNIYKTKFGQVQCPTDHEFKTKKGAEIACKKKNMTTFSRLFYEVEEIKSQIERLKNIIRF